jgi:transposase
MYNFNKMRTLRAQGMSYSEIGREVGLYRATVAKYLRCNSPPKYKNRDGPTRIDPLFEFNEQIKLILEKSPAMSGSEIYELLVEKGYRGSERTIQRRLNIRRGQIAKERDFDQVYEPGEQSQFDFKECVELPFIDGIKVVHLHFGTLPFSDIVRIKAYPNKNYECYMDGIHSFFESIGGMTKNIRFDNLSPVVSKIHDDGRRTYTKKFEQAHHHYGFGLLPCSPGRGNEKGDVERDIQTNTRRFLNLIKLKNLAFKDFSDLNNHLSEFVVKRESEQTQEKFKLEMQQLLPIPRRDEDVLCRSEECIANDFGIVTIMKSTYSVPDEVIGARCWVVPGPYDVKIYRMDMKKLIATHPRKTEGESSILLEHCLRGLIRKPRAMIRWAHREILFPNESFKKFYEKLKQQDALTAEREFLRTINLVQQVPLTEIVTAVELLNDAGAASFEAIKELLLIARRPENVIEISERMKQEPIRPDLEAYNQLIPKTGGV